jgi:hypothetical protein
MADTVPRLFTEPLDGGCCFALFIELLARVGFGWYLQEALCVAS